LNPSETNWTNSSSWSNQTARLARLLNSNSNCLHWTGTRPAFELPLDSWTAYHCSLQLFSVLLNWAPGSHIELPRGFEVCPNVPSRRPQRNHRSSLLKRDLLNRHRGNANPQRAWIRAYVWLLRDTLQHTCVCVVK
jgi:hypothetical protein